MKKRLVSIGLVFCLSAVTSCFTADTTAVVEAKEKKKKKIAYEMTWKSFKKKWKKEAKAYELDNISKIKNYEVRKTNSGPAKYGISKEDLYVGLNTNTDAGGDFGAVSVSGRITPDIKNSDKNVMNACALLIMMADPTISFEKRKKIAFDKLKLDKRYDAPITFEYSYKGVKYTAEHKIHSNGIGTMFVTVKEE